MVRVGTGEVGDSLLLDPLFDLSKEFIEELSGYSNLYFELKTKTGFVDHLLDIPRKGNTVIGFSLNPESIIAEEEGASASLSERLEAADKAVRNGFLLSFHFDPILRIPAWEEAYSSVVKQLSRFPAEKVAWISLGTFRYTSGLKDRIEQRRYLFDEFVPCNDGKFRYVQKTRSRIYRTVKSYVERSLPLVPIYMCMESSAMWRKVFGGIPLSGNMQPVNKLFRQPKGISFYRQE
jgi:spore photoproduct lyase